MSYEYLITKFKLQNQSYISNCECKQKQNIYKIKTIIKVYLHASFSHSMESTLSQSSLQEENNLPQPCLLPVIWDSKKIRS